MSDKSTKEILQNTFGHLDTVVREKRRMKKKTREGSDSRSTTDQAQKQEKEQVADCESSK